MSNYILLCHGAPREFSSFEMTKKQTVQYRGNYGAPVDEHAAARLVKTLLHDPLVSDKQLAHDLPNYAPQPPLARRRASSSIQLAAGSCCASVAAPIVEKLVAGSWEHVL